MAHESGETPASSAATPTPAALVQLESVRRATDRFLDEQAAVAGYAVLPLSRPHGDDSIRSAQVSIERDFKRALRVENLARERHMSARNFMRRFKTATGRTPGDYLQATRIAVAKQLLESGARSVQTGRGAVGYEDAALFRALFKRHTGMSPAEYREKFGASGAPTGRGRPRRGPQGLTGRGMASDAAAEKLGATGRAPASAAAHRLALR